MKKRILLFFTLAVFISAAICLAADEDTQQNILQKILTSPAADWQKTIASNNLISKNFVLLCKDGASYAITQNDIDEAYKFCWLADTAAKKLSIADNYRLGLAFYCYNNKNYKKSLEICSNLEKEKYKDPRLPLIMGLNYKEGKDFKNAMHYLELANKMAPENYDIHYNLGLVYIELGDKENAKTEFKKAMELNPGKPEAKNATQSLEAENINDPAQLLSKAKQLFEENDIPEANKYLKKYLEIDPKNYEVYLLLGKLANRSDDYALALTYLKQSLELNDTNSDTYYYLGFAYEHIYDKDSKDSANLVESKKYYQKAFDMDIKYGYAKNDVKRIEEKIEKHEKEIPNDKTQNPNE